MLHNKGSLSAVDELLSSAICCPDSWCDEWKIAVSEGGNVHYPLLHSRIDI